MRSVLVLFAVALGFAALLPVERADGRIRCPSPLHPPCCPVPCPVIDQQNSGQWSQTQANARRARTLLSSVSGARQRSPLSSQQFSSASVYAAKEDLRLALVGGDGAARPTPRIPDTGGPLLPEKDLPADALPAVRIDPTAAAGGGFRTNEALRTATDERVWRRQRVDHNQEIAIAADRDRDYRRIHRNAYSGFLHNRADMARFAAEHEKMLAMVESAETLADEFRVNAYVRAEVMRELGRVASVQEVHQERVAGGQVTQKTNVVQPEAPPRLGTAAALPPPSPEVVAEEQTYSAWERLMLATLGTVATQNRTQTRASIQDNYAGLLKIVADHEQAKRDLFAIEGALRQSVGATQNWTAFQAEMLRRDPTTWEDWSTRRQAAHQAASGMVEPADGRTGAPDDRVRQTVRMLLSQSYGNDGYGIAQSYAQIPTTIRIDDEDVPLPSLHVGIQFYLDTHKREVYLSRLRRGYGRDGDMMSADLWAELTRNHRDCLIGPMPATPTNLAAFPGYFDVSPDCAPRRWGAGSPAELAGKPIKADHLGGTDRSIWASRTLYNERGTQEPSTVDAQRQAQQALQLYGTATGGNVQSLPGMLLQQSRPAEARQAQDALRILDQIQGGSGSTYALPR